MNYAKKDESIASLPGPVVDNLKGLTEAPTLTIYRIYPIFFNREVVNVLQRAFISRMMLIEERRR